MGDLSNHEIHCLKAPNDYQLSEEITKDELQLMHRKDVELALDLKEQELDHAKASEVHDEGLAEAIAKSQEEEAIRIDVAAKDYEYCLRLEAEEEETERRRREVEASDFEYAQRLQREMNEQQA